MAKNDKKKNKTKQKWWKRGLRILSWIAVCIFILFLILVLFIRSPWGQNIIVGKLTQFVSGKTHTEVAIKKLYITFSGDIYLEGLYLEDTKGDTLIYSKSLQADIPLWPIIRGNPISIDGLEWDGLRANVMRKDSIEGYNFQFLIDAFASDSKDAEADTTSSEPPKIALGTIDFSDFNLIYDDAVIGMKANLNLGQLHFEGKTFDLKKMRFEVAELSIEDTKINYEQTKPSAPSDTTEATLPFLGLDNLKLKNVIAYYKSIPNGIDAEVNLSNLGLQAPKVDLANQEIEVGDLILDNSFLSLKMDTLQNMNRSPVTDSVPSKKTAPFEWPDWNINAQLIAFDNNHLHYQRGGKPIDQQTFNPNYIDVTNFVFNANAISLSKNNSAKLKLNALSFNESSGLALKNLALNAALDPTSISVDNLEVKTGNSSLNADLGAQFSSIQGFIDHPDKSQFSLNLGHFGIDLNDVFDFQPELKENEYLMKLSKHQVTGKIIAEGKLSKVNLSELLVDWGGETSVESHGEFMNLTNPDRLMANIESFTFNSTRTDLSNIISEEDLGITLPKTIDLQSKFHGSLDDLNAKVQLIVPEGKVKVDGQFKNKNEIAFNAKIDVIDFQLGKILKNADIGTVAFKMDAKGKGNTVNDLNAELNSQFSKLEFNGYDFSALEFDGKMKNGNGNIAINYDDHNLDLNIDSKIQLDSVAPEIAIDFNLKGAELKTLGLTEKDIKAQLKMTANFKGNTDKFDFDSHFSDGVAVYDEDTYYLGNVDINAHVTKDSTSMDIDSDFLNGKLRSNAGIDSTTVAIRNQLESYFSDSIDVVDSVSRPVKLQVSMKLSETKLLTELLVPDIKAMDTLNLDIDFNQKEHKLIANLSLPYLDYSDKTVDSLMLNLNSNIDAAEFKFGFNKLNADPFEMNRTYLDGDLNNGILRLNFNAFDEDKETYVVQTKISGNSKELRIHFDPEKLVFHGEDWSVPEDNQITIHEKEITAEDFILSRNGQKISVANDLIETTQHNVGIEFSNFKLANFMALLNKDNLLASGNLQGSIVVIEPFKNLGLDADFNIDDLIALKAPLGKLSIKANSENGDKYNLDLGLKGDNVDLAIKGDYSLKNIGSELNFKMDIGKIEMKTIAQLSDENLKDASGNISGKMTLTGDKNAPDYKGYLQFNDASFNVSQLNSKFRLANDKIKIDNDDITLDQFSIEDEQNNNFTLNGNISTKDFSDPTFDLSIKAKNFQALNSKKKDNDVFYGDVNFDMDGTIKGSLSTPKINTKLEINEGTDFTYAIQSSQAKMEKRDGIVEFVNIENPDNILTRKDDSNVVAVFGGIDLHAKLKIDKGAEFNVIVDPKTGDNLNISGGGDLDFNIERNGRMTLSGRYVIDKGHYKLSLYNLVKRKFEFEPGSSVSWGGGDPLDADLDVTAKYALETSASPLMASQTAGASDEVKNKYRQRLPFFVFLNVKGQLDEPQLNFLLGMPENSKGAIDGTVYSRIKQINTEEDALNKQVFSLLVLKKFYPNSGSDGSGGGAARLVKKNINDAISDQLNAYSDKLMGNSGVELNFGLNSYTDYQGKSAEERTDLNVTAQKKLLNDRLIVQVGSTVNIQGDSHPGEENAVVGNASIQYLLTEDGRWRLKGFRDSEYENVLDGQVFVNGISIIFQRQFNKFSELFGTKPKKQKEEKENDETDKKKK